VSALFYPVELRGTSKKVCAIVSRVRVAIIGAGFIGSVHAKAALSAGAIVTGIANRDLDIARVLQERVGAERVTDSAEDLIESSDVDVVHVCTPNASHRPFVEKALRAGKHVICEKPLAMDVAEAASLKRLAASVGVVAAVPFVYRYYPMVREIRERVRDGGAGTLSILHGSYLQDWLSSESESNWRVDSSLGGVSRAFADIGVHWVDLAEFTTGQRIARLCAQLRTVYPTRQGTNGPIEVKTEDAASIVFETDGGALGSLVISQVSPGRKNRLLLSIDGTEACFVFNQEEPDTLWIGGRSTNQVLARSPDGLRPGAARYAIVPAGHPQGFQDCFNAFVADCYTAIDGESPDGLPLFADGLRAAQITEAVLDSASRKDWTEVKRPA
jgi:predicted dehydrogenase